MYEDIIEKAIDPERKYDLGIEHLKAREYTLAAACFEHDANNGFDDAQYRLGVLYECGLGVEKNYGEAARLFELAAGKNNMYAQLRLGVCYATGMGVKFDDGKANEYFIKAVKQLRVAANAGNVEAQCALGDYYGLYSVKQDFKSAVKWWNKAAESGDVQAQFFLGACYKDGYGVDKNAELARKWLEKAYEQGHETAGILLAEVDCRS